jgi:hypothetical protein
LPPVTTIVTTTIAGSTTTTAGSTTTTSGSTGTTPSETTTPGGGDTSTSIQADPDLLVQFPDIGDPSDSDFLVQFPEDLPSTGTWFNLVFILQLIVLLIATGIVFLTGVIVQHRYFVRA